MLLKQTGRPDPQQHNHEFYVQGVNRYNVCLYALQFFFFFLKHGAGHAVKCFGWFFETPIVTLCLLEQVSLKYGT